MSKTKNELIQGYSEFITTKLTKENYQRALFVTFTFNNISHRPSVLRQSIDRFVDNFYNYLITYLIRYPRKAVNKPILITAYDKPDLNQKKQIKLLCDSNGGVHLHCILLIPSAIKTKRKSIEQIINDFKSNPSGQLLHDLHVTDVYGDILKLVSYTLKSIDKFDNEPVDNIIVLPKAASELSSFKQAS
jgi:hypothetical protein